MKRHAHTKVDSNDSSKRERNNVAFAAQKLLSGTTIYHTTAIHTQQRNCHYGSQKKWRDKLNENL